FGLIGRVFLQWYEQDWGEWGVEYYLEEYETGFFSDFWGMMDTLLYGSIACVVVGLVVWFIAKKLDTAPQSKVQ
ncbi:MAG: hypothetical protein Q4C22_05725, partial [Bacillota bacterium]|nr:hypothetical protein [Bacillota bacterium]